MSDWISELRENIATEFDRKPAVVTLATIKRDGSPDARSVVLRNLFDDGRMLITSDARSEKNKQLKTNPAATAVLWLPEQKKQFRIDGQIHVLNGEDPIRLQAWGNLSDSARALFYWPPAGQPREDINEQQFRRKIEIDQPLPTTFEVLLLHPKSIDMLDLNPHPHLRRKCFRITDQWSEIVINP